MTKKKDETTLRDIYAGMAMQAFVEKTTTVHVDNNGDRHLHHCSPAEVSKVAFRIADAMMAERNKGKA